MHVYFVAYDVPNLGTFGGKGNMEILLDREITGIAQIRAIEQSIGDSLNPPTSIVVNNWILLSTPDN